MIPWGLSDWSTNDLIRAVGLKRSQFGSSVFATNQWLYVRGYMERVPGPLRFHDDMLAAAAMEVA